MIKRGKVLLLAITFLFAVMMFVYAGNFLDNTSEDFNNGTYSNTEYNGSAVVLSSGQTSGNFTSQIFDAGSDANWDNLSWIESEPIINFLFAVDGAGDIYSSTDFENWTQKADNYGRTSDTQYMFSFGDFIYILSNSNREVWRSGDLGVTWQVINDSFADSGLLIGESDSNGNLFVVDASGDIYISQNNGVDWILKGDFNGASSNNAKGIGVNLNGSIFVVDGSGAVFASPNQGINWTEQNSSYGGSTGTDDLVVDNSGNLYILLNKNIYKSTDEGVTWNIVNDSFTSYSNDGFRFAVNSNDNLFVADGVGRIFKSNDEGVTWFEQGDFNAGAGSNPKGLTNFLNQTNLNLQVRNCSLSNCSDGNWQNSNLSSLNLISQYFQYKVSFDSPDTSKSPYIESVSINYDLINSAPSLTLVSPQNGATYGYNESLALSFSVSDSDGNLDSCWYNLNESMNISLPSCSNSSFNVSGNGNYVLTIYANDTDGKESSDSASFSVNINSPTIVLSSPINVYLNYQENIEFNYTSSDFDLDACELWGDFTGTFELNQTDLSPLNNSVNNFVLNLSDGTYLWNIKCNDTQSHETINGNQTFYVDTINPSLTVTEPTGTKTSLTVTAGFSIIDNFDVDYCYYNVTDVNGAVLISDIEIANCGSNTSLEFILGSDETNANFNIWTNDSAGNVNYSTSAFSVNTDSGGSGNSGSSSGGGSGGGSLGNAPIVSGLNKLEIENIGNLIVDAGESKEISLSARNAGTNFLNDCGLKAVGEFSSWISVGNSEDLSAGEKYDFVFDLNVPEDIGAGKYNLNLFLKCQETNKTIDFIAEIIEKKLGFELVDVRRTKEKDVKVDYLLKELSGVEQDVELQFLLFNSDGEQVAEFTDKRIISANTEKEFDVVIALDSSLSGELNLLVNLNSETYSTFVQESIILGSSISGFSIFGDAGTSDNVISSVLVVLFLGFAFIIVRKILSHKKELSTGKKKNIKIKEQPKLKPKKDLKKTKGFFQNIFWKVFPKKDNRGVVLIDSKVIDILKKEASKQDCKGKYVKLSLRKKKG